MVTALFRRSSFHRSAAGLPDDPGAYVLLIDLPSGIVVRLSGRPAILLADGCYLYCGSAYGPGGIRARVGRHMRREKPIRWHVDQLTASANVLGAWAVPGGSECALAASLSALPMPIPGFGSSDCPRCVSHLLAWPAGAPPAYRCPGLPCTEAPLRAPGTKRPISPISGIC
jgi:Uri superfamily endonuclease